VAIWFALALAGAVVADTDAWPAQDPFADLIRIGLSSDVFYDVTKRDAEIALGSWAREIVRMARRPMDTSTVVHDDADAVAASVARGELDLFGVTGLDYLRLKGRIAADPALAGDRGRGPEDELLIVTRRDKGIARIADLAARSLMVPAGAMGVLARMWLDVELVKHGQPEAARFFGELRSVSRPSQAVLPVFFRQADAAVVTQAAYATLREMNPQLGRDLIEVSRSMKLLSSLLLFSRQAGASKREIAVDSALRLRETTTGKQVLLLFRITKVVPFEASWMDGVTQLVREHAALRGGRRS
jgi:ABC-type phosphate/phosphonate transport system substrate-binding protein